MTTVPEKASFSVVVHPFDSPTPQACAYEHVTPTSAKARHALVFIGGLTDGPHTVPCVRTLAQRLAQYDVDAEAGGKPALGYSVFELRMSSSFYSYGIKRLADDVADLSALVKHLREQLGRQKIVFLGHSTGCQDSMSYAKAAKDGASPAIDGYILQGPVSDRECIVPHMKPGELERMLTVTERMIREGRENAIVPAEDVAEMIDLPHTAYRLHSLVAFKYVGFSHCENKDTANEIPAATTTSSRPTCLTSG